MSRICFCSIVQPVNSLFPRIYYPRKLMTLSEVQIFRQYSGKQKLPRHIIILFSSFLKSINACSGSFFPLLIVCKKIVLLLSVTQVLTFKRSYRKCKATFLSPSVYICLIQIGNALIRLFVSCDQSYGCLWRLDVGVFILWLDSNPARNW